MDYPRKIYQDREGVVEGARPFFIASRPDNDRVVMIIHGFTSSPYQMHFIADTLAAHGYDVDSILLAGHGGGLENLRRSSVEQWVASAEAELKKNLARYKKLYLLGYSFGANLAIHLSVRYPAVRGIISMGIPIILYKEKSIRALLPLAKLVMRDYKKKWIAPEEIKYLYERGHHVYIPIKNLVQFRKFIVDCTKKDIAHLQTPILIGHNRHDRVADPRSSQYLFEHLAVKDKSLYIMSRGDHQIENGVSREFIAKKILHFLERH